jgi:hypothetical protein
MSRRINHGCVGVRERMDGVELTEAHASEEETFDCPIKQIHLHFVVVEGLGQGSDFALPACEAYLSASRKRCHYGVLFGVLEVVLTPDRTDAIATVTLHQRFRTPLIPQYVVQ